MGDESSEEGRTKCCVLCKRHIAPWHGGRTEHGGHPAYNQCCPSCGSFVAEAPAICILDRACEDEARTREQIVEHFSWFISSEKLAGRVAIITADHAQNADRWSAVKRHSIPREEASLNPVTRTVENRERLASRIGVPMNAIEAFCDRWQVEELALFGSVLCDDFGPDSDIDVLVRFKTERTPGLFGIAGMERELAELLARKVDLVNRAAIEESRNYIRRKAILESARVVYAA